MRSPSRIPKRTSRGLGRTRATRPRRALEASALAPHMHPVLSTPLTLHLVILTGRERAALQRNPINPGTADDAALASSPGKWRPPRSQRLQPRPCVACPGLAGGSAAVCLGGAQAEREELARVACACAGNYCLCGGREGFVGMSETCMPIRQRARHGQTHSGLRSARDMLTERLQRRRSSTSTLA